jgi:transposase
MAVRTGLRPRRQCRCHTLGAGERARILIGLRSVEKRVQGWRREMKAHNGATVRFETRPGHQLQIDFGELGV